MKTSGVVVAGGKSQRMGQDKRRLKLWGDDGPTLLDHTVAVVRSLCDEVIVVLNDASDWPQLDARVVGDVYAGGGSLGGIYSGVQAAQHSYAFVVAADMPLLNPDLMRWMRDQPRDYDVLVPRLADAGKARNRLSVESLHAVYSTACLPTMQQQLDQGNPQVIGFFDQVRVQIIEAAVWLPFDTDGAAFWNVNTPDDVARVRARIERTGA